MVFGLLFVVIIYTYDENLGSLLIALPLLSGFAGLIVYPHKSSAIILIAVFFAVGPISFPLLNSIFYPSPFPENIALSLAVGTGLGLPAGAVASRILLGMLRKSATGSK
jgi:hypothetical protein